MELSRRLASNRSENCCTCEGIHTSPRTSAVVPCFPGPHTMGMLTDDTIAKLAADITSTGAAATPCELYNLQRSRCGLMRRATSHEWPLCGCPAETHPDTGSFMDRLERVLQTMDRMFSAFFTTKPLSKFSFRLYCRQDGPLPARGSVLLFASKSSVAAHVDL